MISYSSAYAYYAVLSFPSAAGSGAVHRRQDTEPSSSHALGQRARLAQGQINLAGRGGGEGGGKGEMPFFFVHVVSCEAYWFVIFVRFRPYAFSFSFRFLGMFLINVICFFTFCFCCFCAVPKKLKIITKK